jgi:hypothetical protein
VLTKSYGTVLVDGLPPARRVIGPWSEVRREVHKLFGTRRTRAVSLPSI